MITELTVYNAKLSNLIEGEILEDGNLCNVVKAIDLNETLKSVRDELSEAENKAIMFNQFTSKCDYKFDRNTPQWYGLCDGVRKWNTGVELFASQEFLTYLSRTK